MSTPWRPEREITTPEARDAVLASGYDGPLRTVRIIAAGWDNTIVLVDAVWVFRFPRRAIALPGIHREIAHLPALAVALPLPVPQPVWTGSTGEPEWPFWGGRHLAGDELAQRPEVDRVTVAGEVGRFLRALHDLPVIEALPVDPMGRADSAMRAGRARTILTDLADLGVWSGSADIDPVLSAADDLEPSTVAPVVCHGDLYSRHVLVDEAGHVSGIIDWGDMCLADPAVDLAVAFSAFTGDARAALLLEYGPIDDETRLRAQTMGIFSAASIAHYAHDTGDEVLLREAIAGLAGIGWRAASSASSSERDNPARRSRSRPR